MNTSTVEKQATLARQVKVTSDSLTVDLTDGRTMSVPIAWYPRLSHGTIKERNRWRLIGSGEGIHWPDLDEDISVDNLLAGARSAESQRSFKQWLEHRTAGGRKTATSKR